MQRTTVGNIELIALVDNIQPYAAATVYPALGDAIERYRQHLDAESRIPLNFACFLARDGDNTLLVDTGWGPEYEGRLLDELREAGVASADITTVLFTHLHGDHTGWNLDRGSGQLQFPNARYLVPKLDWDHYSTAAAIPPARTNDSFERDIRPLEGLGVMDLVEGERTLSAGLTAIPTPGHTPGHTSVLISSQGQRGIILGDVVISALDAEDPTIESIFDWDNAIAKSTRQQLVDRLIADGSLVGASHLPAPGLGHFVRAEGRQYWQRL